MFTGIVEETGIIKSVKWSSHSAIIGIKANKVLCGLKIGDSINTNGACLTVTSFDNTGFSVGVMSETMRRTNLNKLSAGSQVNLERALRFNDRLGGHFVSGHIDGTGIITGIRKEDIATWITVNATEDMLKYIVLKGSVALDGISLTIADVAKKQFMVTIIPHTTKETTLLSKNIGNKINIECDLIGKYIEKFMLAKPHKSTTSKIDMDFLKNSGFLL